MGRSHNHWLVLTYADDTLISFRATVCYKLDIYLRKQNVEQSPDKRVSVGSPTDTTTRISGTCECFHHTEIHRGLSYDLRQEQLRLAHCDHSVWLHVAHQSWTTDDSRGLSVEDKTLEEKTFDYVLCTEGLNFSMI